MSAPAIGRLLARAKRPAVRSRRALDVSVVEEWQQPAPAASPADVDGATPDAGGVEEPRAIPAARVARPVPEAAAPALRPAAVAPRIPAAPSPLEAGSTPSVAADRGRDQDVAPEPLAAEGSLALPPVARAAESPEARPEPQPQLGEERAGRTPSELALPAPARRASAPVTEAAEPAVATLPGPERPKDAAPVARARPSAPQPGLAPAEPGRTPAPVPVRSAIAAAAPPSASALARTGPAMAAAAAQPPAASPPGTSEPPIVIEQIHVVTPPARPPEADPLASLAGRRVAASRHRGSR